ncbi:MAG: MBL fold metallo-hydrolase [Candidatus Aenigmarchaeota archaeon]|nr:MBL fold metallo-hydrolase [Candidatus Aenigmarchaeota archaeon]
MADSLDNLVWFGHSSFLLTTRNNQNFYFVDPFDLKSTPKNKADIVFITHAHYDHWSTTDLRTIITDKTLIVAVNGCDTRSFPKNRFIITEPNKEMKLSGVDVKTVPAYNVKHERLSYHPKQNKWVGYVFTIDGRKIYHAGDTDFIPEMRNLTDIDVALLPIGGTYVMDVKEAIDAANAIQAKTTIPIHYKRLLGSKAKEAEDKFVAGVKGQVLLLDEFK